MFKDLRVAPSSPQHWAGQLGRSGNLRRRIAGLRLQTGLDRRWRHISRRLPAGGLILDAGCSTGVWLEFLERKGLKGYGLDYSFELLRQRTSQDGSPRVCGAIQQLPLKEGSFDGSVSWGVIEHDEEGPARALTEILRVTKPGGWVFLTVPRDHPRVRRAFAIEREAQSPPGEGHAVVFYQYLLSESDLRAALTEAGFEVDIITGANRHAAVAFPRLHLRLDGLPAAMRDLLGRVLWCLSPMVADSTLMILAVARRPLK